MFDSSTVCPTGRTKRLHDTIVGPTSRTDQSVRRSYRLNAQLVAVEKRAAPLRMKAKVAVVVGITAVSDQ